MVSKVRGTHKGVPLLLPHNRASASLQTLKVCWESSAEILHLVRIKLQLFPSACPREADHEPQVKHCGKKQHSYSFKLLVICFYKMG